DAALVAVHDAVAHRLLVLLLEHIGRPAVDTAPPVRILDRLDLDDVRAEIGERTGADRPGPAHREVDHAHARERKVARRDRRYDSSARSRHLRRIRLLLADAGHTAAT